MALYLNGNKIVNSLVIDGDTGGGTELPKFKDFYTIPSLSTITGTITACYAMRNLFGAGTNEHFWHICTDTDPFIYYNTNSNQIIRDNRWVSSGYLPSINVSAVWCESVTPALTPSPNRATGTGSYNISQNDLGNYLYLRTTDILDQNGNIILPANCTIEDFGITQ